MFLLSFIGRLVVYLWRQLMDLLCPFRSVGQHGSSSRRTSLLLRRPDEASLTEDYQEFAYQHTDKDIRLCAFYFAGYMLIVIIFFSFVFERWSITESLYFGIVTLTTIGYGDLQPSNDATRLFLIFFAIYGVAILGIFLGILGHAFFDMQQRAVTQRRNTTAQMALKAITEDTPVTKEDMCSSVGERSLTIDVWRIVVLETPIILLVLLFSLLLGYLEGWTVIQGLYFGVISITTVGTGDISPHRDVTRLMCVFFLPIAVAVFGETISRIAALYFDRKARQREREFLNRCITMVDLKRMDANKDGVVSESEFLSFMLIALQKVDAETVESLKQTFRSLDVNFDGVISKEDLLLMTSQRTGWSSLQSMKYGGDSS